MRTPTEALKEVRDRLTYFCARLDGKYDPLWVHGTLYEEGGAK